VASTVNGELAFFEVIVIYDDAVARYHWTFGRKSLHFGEPSNQWSLLSQAIQRIGFNLVTCSWSLAWVNFRRTQ
jgi:hypothetical protein